MPNANTPFGIVPSRHLMGGVIRSNVYHILDGLAANIYEGDPVKLQTDGTITVAAAGERCIGIFAGCRYTRESDMQPVWDNKWLSGTNSKESVVEAYVYDDPNIEFEIQGGNTAYAQANIGSLADHVAGTPNTLLGKSGALLSTTTGTGAATFRILGLSNRADNAWGAYAVLRVQFFEHELVEHGQTTPGV